MFFLWKTSKGDVYVLILRQIRVRRKETLRKYVLVDVKFEECVVWASFTRARDDFQPGLVDLMGID